MPLLLDTSPEHSADELRSPNCITVGLVNNMPDAAVEAAERQFADLIRAAASRLVVRLKLFSIPDMPRADDVRRKLAERYRDISSLWDSHIDGLIVTGTEPRDKILQDEPYWRPLSQVVDWARDNTTSAIWSCLGAHAAVLHGDGIARQPFAAKLFGVFNCAPAGLHPMTIDAAQGLRVPHSRYNDLPERELVAAGYRILTRSAAAGVDMFARHEKSFHLFMQGHLEYEATTLLREYRRDVCRYLKRERDDYPSPPVSYFDATASALAAEFREQALASRSESLIAAFPTEALQSGLQCPWRACAVGIYEKWLEYINGRKSDRRPLTAPLRRAWRDWPPPGVRSAG